MFNSNQSKQKIFYFWMFSLWKYNINCKLRIDIKLLKNDEANWNLILLFSSVG